MSFLYAVLNPFHSKRRFKLIFVFALSLVSIQAIGQIAAPVVSGNLSVCNGSTTTLTATGQAGATFAWYTQASGGSLLSTSAVFTTPAITANKNFYVQQTAGGFTSLRTSVSVLVVPVPVISSPQNLLASPSAICAGKSSNLSATVDASAGQYVYWYDSSAAGNLLGSSVSGGNFLVTPIADKTYYAQSQSQIITQTFNVTFGVQTFVVPAGVTSIQVDARGARGARYRNDTRYAAEPGHGGRVQATMNVTPGQVLYIYVGQAGQAADGYSHNSGGYNGGGNVALDFYQGGAGGGATDIRLNGQTLLNRVLVAGGGGGDGIGYGQCSGGGGDGGGLVGANGNLGQCSPGYVNAFGQGGTQTGGGGGIYGGAAGTLGQGGDEGSPNNFAGSGGGGGYFGGGGTGNNSGGGGGSSYTDATMFQNVIHTQGYQNGDGQLTISYNASANCALTTRQPVTVHVSTTPTVNANANFITCQGTAATLTATGADTYTWQPGNLTGANISVTPDSTTTYTVTGTTSNGCSNTSTVTATVTTVVASATQTICLGSTATISATGADSYTWQPGNLTGQSVQVVPTATTIYTVTGHNNIGCNTTAQDTVKTNPLPPVNAGGPVTVAAGANVTLTATGADTYSWFPVPSNNASVTFIPATTTTATVTGTYTATGCSNTYQVVVTVPSVPVVTGNTNVCPGGTASLTATGTGPFSWYSSAAGGSAIFTGPVFTTPAITADTAYWVAGNSSQRIPVSLTIAYPYYNAVATPPTICMSGKSTLNITNANQTIRWYDAATGGNLLDTTTNGNAFIASPPANKIYYAQLQVQPVADTFNVTFGVQTFVVPAGVTSIQVDARGARGAKYRNDTRYAAEPGHGGRVQATMNVTPGQVLYIYVGQAGQAAGGYSHNSGGYNGGGNVALDFYQGGAGGGATDIRMNGQTLLNRVLVAGGGGGDGDQDSYCSSGGGDGGGLVGADGNAGQCATGYYSASLRGHGGTQTAGGAGGAPGPGAGGYYGGPGGSAGSLGQGGDEELYGNNPFGGAGGGGGYYGGGGTGGNGGGGGGSSYTDATMFQNVIHTQGYQNGDGQLIISYGTANNCIITLPDTVKVNPALNAPLVTASITADTVLAGNPVTLNVTGNANAYTWNNNVQSGVAFIPAASGFYVVTGTAANGCTNVDSVTLYVIQHIDSYTPATATQGTTVTIHGGKFNGSSAVSFGGTPASSFNVLNDTTITAVVAQGTTGDLAVTTPGGVVTKNGFFYSNPPGNALNFNGSNQYVTINTPSALSGGFTVEAWVRPMSTTQVMNIFSTRNGSNDHSFDMKLQGGNTIHADIGDGTLWLTNSADASLNYEVGKWYHIAYVVSTSGYTIYANGVQVGSGTFATSAPMLYNSLHTATIGANGSNSEYFNGSIDELRVYDTTLAQASIQADMQSMAISVTGHIKNYYTFDQSAGTALYDIARGYNGTLSGNPSWVESYAMVVPTASTQTHLTGISFTANWTAPVTGTVDNNYRLDVATDSLFANKLESYSGATVSSDSANVTGLALGTTYYYRLRADKTSVTGQGAYSNIIKVLTYSTPAITSFSPTSAKSFDTVTIKGTQLFSTTGVSFGGRPAVSFVVVSDSVVKAVVANGVSGSIAVTTTVNTATLGGFTYIATVPYTTPGNSLNFANGSYVSVATGKTSVAGSFTIEAWIRPANNTQNMVVFSSRHNSEFDFDISLDAGKALHGDIGTGSNWLTTSANAVFIYNANQWYHIAYVVTPSGYNIYIDGALAGSGSFSGTPLLLDSVHNLVTIGGDGFNNVPFSGNMDEIKVWNTARTQSQIMADRANIISNPTADATVVAYYNFDEGVASGANPNIISFFDQSVNGLNGYLNNFALTGNTGNWIESYAMVVPVALAAANVTANSFTANWSSPALGKANSYLLDIATDTLYNNIVSGYNAKIVTDTFQTVAGLQHATVYYYRVRANKATAPGPGIYSNNITVGTLTAPNITSFTPSSAAKDSVVTITGNYFTGVTGVSFGGVPADSFTVVDDATITAVVGTGATGSIYVTAPSGTDSITGFILALPKITSFKPNRAYTDSIVTISGANFMSATAVSFGGVPAKSFTVVNGTTITATVANGASGIVSVTTPTGTGVLSGFTFAPPLIPPGNALNFANGAYVSVPTGGTTITGSFTVEAWVRPANNTQHMMVFSSRAIGDLDFDMALDVGNTLHGDIGTGNAWLTTSANAAFLYKPNQWYHIAYVVTPSGYKIYIDGILSGSGSFSGTPLLLNSTHNLVTIGGDGFNNVPYSGNMDEIKVWNTARTQAQIITDRNNIITSPESDSTLKAYYNFDEGIANGTNGSITSLLDQTPNYATGTLNNFSLTGNTSNWVESYAAVIPTAMAASNIAGASFTANWAPSAIGVVDNGYRLDVATDSLFTHFVNGDSALTVNANSANVTGLTGLTTYYYRVRADKASVTGQGVYSAVVKVTTTPFANITSFSPKVATGNSTITITGINLNLVTAVSFGGNPAASFTIVNADTILAIVGGGSSGNVAITSAYGTDSLPSFLYAALPAFTSFSPLSATISDTVTIHGSAFATTTAVSFGGTPASAFNVISDSIVTAIVSHGSSGNITITTAVGTATLPGFIYTVKAPPGNALNFNGNSNYVSVPVGTKTVSGSFTVEAWVRPVNSLDMVVFSTRAIGDLDFDISFDAGKTVHGDIGNGSNWLTTSANAPLPFIYNPGHWFHIAYAVSPSGYTIYINGQLSGSGSFSGTPLLLNSAHNLLTIGGDGHNNNPFNGNIDEVKIWNTTRTPAQIIADRDNIITNPPGDTTLVAYYNFDEGIAGGSNTSTDSLYDLSANNLTGALKNFGLTGSIGNWVESYAMVVPVIDSATNVTGNSFVAAWSAPLIGTVENYLLDVSTAPNFSTFINNYGSKIISADSTSTLVSGLTNNTKYYYRVRAEKASVTGQGSNSAVMSIKTLPIPIITSFSPIAARKDSTVTIKGSSFNTVTAVSFGNTAAASFSILSDSIITAVVGTGASGDIILAAPGGMDTSLTAFTYIPQPVILSITQGSGSAGLADTLKGAGFTGASLVSFGGTKAASFIVQSDSVIIAVIGGGATGDVVVKAAGFTATLPSAFTFISTVVSAPGNTLNFNGSNNYVSIPRPVSGDFTIEYWMRTTQTGGGGQQWYQGNGIVDGEMPGAQNDFGTSLLGSKLCFGIGEFNQGDVSLISASDVNTGHWVHIAVVRDSAGGQIKLYINGVLEASTGAGSNSLTTPPSLTIGRINTGSNYFKGSIDELRIFTSDRSANIQSDMLNTIDPNTAGLAAYYNFDEGIAGSSNTNITALVDQTANNLTGTLNNFTLTGNTSNWVESYAMVVPVTAPPSNVTDTSLTANWAASVIGTVDNYFLDVSTAPDFSSFVSGYHAISVPATTFSQAVTGLAHGIAYYYRVSADKASVTGQGAYSASAVSPVINTFSPAAATSGATVTINGSGFVGVTAVNFGGTPATSFTVVNPNTITAQPAAGSSGIISVIASGGTATKGGFYYGTPPGNALAFDGVDDNVVISPLALNNFSAATYETWLYLNDSTKGTILAKQSGGTATSVFSIGYFASSGSPAAGTPGKVYFSSTSASPVASSNTILQTGHWYHVAVVYTNTNAKIYINGVLDNTTAGDFTTPDIKTGTAALGAWPGTGQYLNGKLDELRIWNTAFSDAQIQAEFLNVTDPSTAGLVAYYNFDAGIADGSNVLSDLGANDYNGTLTNFALTGNTSNYVESYAMVIPTVNGASNVLSTSFTANWSAPAVGTVQNYLLDVATDSAFTSLVTGYSAQTVSTTSQQVTGLTQNTKYFYRVRADAPSVTGQGGFSATTYLTLPATVTVTSISPTSATIGAADTIRGAGFNHVTAVSFGGIAARSYTTLSDSVIVAIIGTGATGDVSVTGDGGTGVLPAAFTFVDLTPPGNTLNFNGSSNYVYAPRAVSGDFTIEFWMQTTQSGRGFAWSSSTGIIDCGAGTGATNAFGITLGFFGLNFGIGSPGQNTYISSVSNVATGKWVHVAAVRVQSTGQIKLYINGVLEATGTATTQDLTASPNIAIGVVAVTGRFGYKGSLDELRFFNTDRSANIVSDMQNTIPASTPGLVAYYNFDEGLAGANNSGNNTDRTLIDKTGNGNNGNLYNFGLNGATSNWIESYAMVVPTVAPATNVAGNSFTANWSAPLIGTVDNYLLDVSTAPGFSTLLQGYNAKVISSNSTSQLVTGLPGNTTYYYRVSASKASVAGQGGYSATDSVTTPLVPVIASFTPQAARTDSTVTITGSGFTGATAVSFGGTPAASFTVVSDTLITAVVGYGSSGIVSVTTPALGTGVSITTPFTYIQPLAITSISLPAGTLGTLDTIRGTGLTDAGLVSFGGTPALSFTVLSDSVITAIVGKGASGDVHINAGSFSATLPSAFTYVVQTPPGNALNFNGISQISVPTASVTVSGNYTVEAWVMPADPTATMNIFSTRAAGGDQTFDMKLQGGNTIHADIGDGSSWITIGADGSFNYAVNKWYHIAYAVSPAGYTIYVNGAPVGSGSLSSLPLLFDSVHNLITIGSNNGGENFNGNIDEVRVWNTTRTQGQISGDMLNVSNPALAPDLVAYYNFDEGNSKGNNAGIDSLYDQTANNLTGTLNNFILTGNTSNWVESYAMALPTINATTNINDSGFTASWVAPTTGIVDNYLLDIATDGAFTNFVAGYNAKPVAGTTVDVAGLARSGTYYYRVSANKASVAGQGAYSATDTVILTGPPVINSFTPTVAATNATVTITGFKLMQVTGVSLGNVPAASFNIVNDTTITAVVGNGATGWVYIYYPGGSDSSNNIFQYDGGPTITSFAPVTATLLDTVTITGKGFTPATNVTFGGIKVISFVIKNDSTISAVVGTGASGKVSVTTPGGSDSLAGFTYIAKTPPGNALNFNGSSYVSTPMGNNYIAGNYTVEAWIKPQNPQDQTNQVSIINTDPNLSIRSFGMTLVLNYIEIFFGNGSRGIAIADVPFNYTAGKWYHVACAVSNNAYTVFVNGKPVHNGNFRFPSSFTSFGLTTMTIGGDAKQSLQDDFYGNIDEVRVWTTTRTQAQVSADMLNVVANPTDPTLAVYYNFDQGNAGGINTGLTTLYDQTANQFNGTLNSFNLTGDSSNWVESYAMAVPAILPATSVNSTVFTANWSAPAVGIVDNYLLDVANDSVFSSLVPGYNSKLVTGTSQVVSGLTLGNTYYYRVRANKASVDEQGGYSNFDTVTTAVSNLTATINGNASVCKNATAPLVIFTGYGSTAPYTFTYTVNGGTNQTVTTAGTDSTVTVSVPTATPGNFTYTLLNVTDSAGKQQSQNSGVTVTVKQPTSSITHDTICSTSLPFHWNGTDYNAAGTYSYTTTNAAGCDSVATLILQVVTNTMSATYSSLHPQVCYGSIASSSVGVKNGIAPYLYSLDGSTTYQDSAKFRVPAGSHSVTVKDAAGCTVTTNSITITQPAQPLGLNLTGSASCSGGAVTASATGSYGNYLYSLNNISYQAGNVLSVASPGTYTVYVKDQQGCKNNRSITVKPLSATLIAPQTAACYGAREVIQVTANYGKAPYQYSLDGVNYQGSANFNVQAGTYTVTVKDTAGCTAVSNSVTITQPAAPLSMNLAANVNCSSGGGTITVNASGGYGNYKYSINGINYHVSNVFTVASAGTYTMNVKDQNGCVNNKNVTVSPLSATLTAAHTAACYGAREVVQVTARYGNAPYSYSLDGVNYQSSANFNVQAGTYSVTVKDTAGCTVTTNSVTIIQPSSLLRMTITPTNVSCNGGSDGSMTVSPTGGYASLYSYSLNGGSYQAPDVFSGLQAGTFMVTVKDSNGCIVNKTTTITQPVTPCTTGGSSIKTELMGGLKVKVYPNPSANDFNLVLESGDSKKVVEIRVVDMFGKTVYHTTGSIFDMYRFGNTFAAGIYIAEVLNGTNVQTIKLVKSKPAL